MLYHETTTKPNKNKRIKNYTMTDETKLSAWLISKLCLFGCLFEESEFTANSKNVMQIRFMT